MNKKQQQLTFEKGITNVPSDTICSDNSLAESVGMVYADGEHRVIQEPKLLAEGKYTIVFTHVTTSGKNYITATSGSAAGYYKGIDAESAESLGYNPSGSFQFSAVGNTLILADANGLHYWLWKGSAYVKLGQKIPEPEVTFRLTRNVTETESANGSFTGIMTYDNSTNPGKLNIQAEHRQDVENLIIGLYSKTKKAIKRRKGFCQPFFVRYGLELYDGSYTYLSNPVLCYPSVTSNSAFFVDIETNLVYITTYFAFLQYSFKNIYQDWGDIVKDLVIFVSKEVNIYKENKDFGTSNIIQLTTPPYVKVNGIWENGSSVSEITPPVPSGITRMENWAWNALDKRSDGNILEDLKGTSQFFKLCSVGLENTSGFSSVAKHVEEYTLENIETQEQAEHDDYYSHTPKKAGYIYSYNNRLHLAQIQRGFFGGFKQFSACTSGSAVAKVSIRTSSGDFEVSVSGVTGHELYFYYPDPRAHEVTIGSSTTHQLTEHAGLNGAYWIADLPTGNISGTNGGSPVTNTGVESLPNRILVSPTNNPFVFNSDGDVTVGSGEVIGMGSLTTALSQGQFGQYPLVAFCTDGVWALSIDGTGVYQAVKPMSREVCNNPKSIIETDGAVFFTSKKGLMVVVGGEVRCMSEQVMGKTDGLAQSLVQGTANGGFAAFFEGCRIAYDYRDSLLWIFNTNYQHCVIYSIKSRTFSKYDFGKTLMSICKDYPDYLLQFGGGNVYTLTGRDDINADNNTHDALLLTRPMKLENGLALKSIMQVKHIGDMEGTLKLRIFSSNDLRNWTERKSLRGVPMKYYRFLYEFSDLLATDRFAGSVLITQERRTDKLR